ncbi:MAG: protein phosphatase 2C domain-containing protein [Prevotellaceae bacterium]|jgi:serine/threonine protein phosphatase PrpC|nr:protein phosphatase 2C domain-containing protein [Prevotellaceae bacterium]
MNTLLKAGNTDVGCVRDNNEDAYIVQTIWDDNHLLAVVIDGVGGYEGGEVAAEIARTAIIEYMEQSPNGERLELLKQAVVEANNRIVHQRQEQPKLAHMSCVLTACLIDDGTIYMVHVGDTRLYDYDPEARKLNKYSHDHSFIGYREEIGDLTEEEAMNHPQRNVISRDVGSEIHRVDDEEFLEANTFPLFPHHTLLLCSDGLCDTLTTQEMISVLQQPIAPEEKVNALIDLAKQKNVKDNVTVIVIENKNDANETSEPATEEPQTDNAPPPADNTPTPSDTHSHRIPSWWLLPVALLAFMIGICLCCALLRYAPQPVKEFILPQDTSSMAREKTAVQQKDTLAVQGDTTTLLQDTLVSLQAEQDTLHDTLSSPL